MKQRFGPFWFTVYDGVAANIWFGKTRTPGSWSTVRGRSPPPARRTRTGAFVYLDVIGDTGSHELETPNATGWDRVAVPGATSGLVFPTAASPLDRHRNWGGTLKLNYMFSEDLRTIGAKYYRVSITDADASERPTGARHNWNVPLSWKDGRLRLQRRHRVCTPRPPAARTGGRALRNPIRHGLPPGENWESVC